MSYFQENTQPIQPLQMYTSESYRALNRNPFGDSKKLVAVCVDSWYLIPFTIKKTGVSYDSILTEIILFDLEDTQIQDVTSLINTNVIVDVTTTTGYVRYFATTKLASELPTGKYYLKLTDGTSIWYSEDFKICKLNDIEYPDENQTIKIEYYNTYDAFGFVYQNSFKNFFYLDIPIKEIDPRRLTKELVDENNNEKETFNVYDPQFGLKILCKDYLLDVFYNISQHSTINITNRNGQIGVVDIMTPAREEVTNEFINAIIEFGIMNDERVWRSCDGDSNNIVLVNRTLTTEGGSVLQTEDGQDLLQ